MSNKGFTYAMNDLGSVYSSYNLKTGKNEPPKIFTTQKEDKEKDDKIKDDSK